MMILNILESMLPQNAHNLLGEKQDIANGALYERLLLHLSSLLHSMTEGKDWQHLLRNENPSLKTKDDCNWFWTIYNSCWANAGDAAASGCNRIDHDSS